MYTATYFLSQIQINHKLKHAELNGLFFLRRSRICRDVFGLRTFPEGN
jgi:hypothetical protein